MWPDDLWPTQRKALNGACEALKTEKEVTVVSHTGSGKSRVMRELTKRAVERGKKVTIFVHRRILRDQIIQQFTDEGFDFGVIASGYKDKEAPVQICMNQSAWARFNLPESDLVLWDERHAQNGKVCQQIAQSYRSRASLQVGFTATPVGISTGSLLVASRFQDCLDQGSHLPVKCYGPDRPRWWEHQTRSDGEYSQKDNNRLMQNIYGRVYEHWKLYNPDARPAILFASSSEAARWWVQRFRMYSVRWASIDHERICWNTTENGRLVTKTHENTDRDTRPCAFRPFVFLSVFRGYMRPSAEFQFSLGVIY